jgi:hypothetical protein
MRRAVPIRRLQPVAHLARCGQCQAIFRHRRATHVAAQPLEYLALLGRDVHAGMQREPAGAGRAVRIALQPRQPGRNGLQREQLLPSPGAFGDPVADGMPDPLIERAGLEITSKPRVLDVALDHASAPVTWKAARSSATRC